MAQITGSAFDNSNLTGIKNKTLPRIEKELHDAIYNDSALLRWLDMQGGITRGNSGDGIYIQLLKSKEDTFRAQHLRSPYLLRGQDTHKPGFQDYSEYVGSISIDWVTRKKNEGPEALINYLTTLKDELILKAKDTINTDLYSGSGSGTTLIGLETLIAESPSTGIVHGINRANDTWFQNKSKDSTVSTTDGFGLVGIKDLDVLLKTMSTGQGKNPINMAVCDDTVHSNVSYFGLAVPAARTVVTNGSDIPAKGVKLQSDVELFIRNAPLIWDHACSADSIRLFSTDFVKLYILKDCDFKMLPEKFAEDSFSQNAPIGLVATLMNKNPRHSGVLYNFTS